MVSTIKYYSCPTLFTINDIITLIIRLLIIVIVKVIFNNYIRKGNVIIISLDKSWVDKLNNSNSRDNEIFRHSL
jgi:hypothetical protein